MGFSMGLIDFGCGWCWIRRSPKLLTGLLIFLLRHGVCSAPYLFYRYCGCSEPCRASHHARGSDADGGIQHGRCDAPATIADTGGEAKREASGEANSRHAVNLANS